MSRPVSVDDVRNEQQERAWPRIPLSELLRPADVAVSVQQGQSYPNFGIYSFGRGLFAKPDIEGMRTSASTLYRVKAGNFIYSRLFAFEGSYGLVGDQFDGHFVSNEYPSFELDRSRINPGFLRAYFLQPDVWRAIAMGSKGVGSRRVRVQPDQLLRHSLPLPSLAEQNALVARLDALTEKTRQVEAHLDAVERASSAMILSLHHQLARGRSVHLGDLIELHEISEGVVLTGSYPQVGVRGFGGGLFPKPTLSGAATAYRTFNRLYAGAIVLSQVKGWEGAIAVCPEYLSNWFVSPEYRTFRCKDGKARADYLGELFKTEWFWSRLQDATRGVGARRERTRPEQFLKVEIPMPTLADQSRGMEILSGLSRLKAKHTTIRAANAALLPATLERIFAAD